MNYSDENEKSIYASTYLPTCLVDRIGTYFRCYFKQSRERSHGINYVKRAEHPTRASAIFDSCVTTIIFSNLRAFVTEDNRIVYSIVYTTMSQYSHSFCGKFQFLIFGRYLASTRSANLALFQPLLRVRPKLH